MINNGAFSFVSLKSNSEVRIHMPGAKVTLVLAENSFCSLRI